MKPRSHANVAPLPLDEELDSGAQSVSLQIPAGEVTLAGELEIPQNARGLVLFAHGSGSSRRSPRNQAVAEVLRDAGLATLLFDLLTAEEEIEDAQTGHLRFDIGMLSRRLASVTEEMADDPRSRKLGIAYFGASTGAAAALRVAATPGIAIRAVVSRGGRPDLAGDCLRAVRCPTLLIVGGADEPTLEVNRRAAHALRGPNRIVVIPGATHLFEEPGTLEAVACLTAEFFATHFDPAAAPSAPATG